MNRVKEFFLDESGAIPALYGLAVALLATVILLLVAFWGTQT
jgi:Flp pilus assembly pilin Flp